MLETSGKAGVKIKTVLSGYQEFDFGVDRWDLIAMSYAFVPVRRAAFVKRVTDSLRPGGVLAFEHYLYAGEQWQRDAAGMTGVAAPNELLKIFGNLRILRYEETEAAPDFGTGEAAPIVRLLARKKRP